MRARLLSDNDIPALARFRQLQQLDFQAGAGIGEVAPLTDIGLERLSKLDLPQLVFLNIGDCHNITDAGLAHVGQMRTLTWLNLWSCARITDAGLIYIGQMHAIRQLSLMGCPGITDAGLPLLAKMKNLKVLDLRWCPNITDRGLECLAQKTDWQEIWIGGCPNVTNEAVAKLQSALPNARVDRGAY